MAYKLVEQSGDFTAVPQCIMAHLTQTDGDTIRVALYMIQYGETDPQKLAKALRLPSVAAARRALLYWAGAGLLVKESTLPRPDANSPDSVPIEEIDLSSLNDPNVAVLCSEAQTYLGQVLSRNSLQKLVSYYLNDGWEPDVLLLCCAEVAGQGLHTVGAVGHELERWREAGVETGEEAEKYLAQKRKREQWCAQVASLFDIRTEDLTRWERSAITKWREEWHFGLDMLEEALLHAQANRTIRYVNGILRSWYAQGIADVHAVRGKGQLTGNNILVTERAGVKKTINGVPDTNRQAYPVETPVSQRNWNALLDEALDGWKE